MVEHKRTCSTLDFLSRSSCSNQADNFFAKRDFCDSVEDIEDDNDKDFGDFKL